MNANIEKTLQDLAREALDVACASNLTGVVHGFSRSMTKLRELFPNESTAFFNTHPISILWSQVIGNLTSSDSFTVYSKAYEDCKTLAQR